jgi:putative FmdB family regulatory protein
MLLNGSPDMPKYNFECQECDNLSFERTLKMGEHPTHPCPSCGGDAPRSFSGGSFGFAFQGGGTALANSGVHDHDYPSADKLVGRSAQDRWQTYVNRNEVKKKVRKTGGAEPLMRADGDGYTDYMVMPNSQVKARGKLVDLAVQVGARRKGQ